MSGDFPLVIFNIAVEVQLCCILQSFCTSAQHTACDGQSPLGQWDSPNRCFSCIQYFECTYRAQGSSSPCIWTEYTEYFSYKNTILWYLKTDPGEPHRLDSPPIRTAEWTAGQRGKIGFSTIEERVLASLRGIICQEWNAEMIRCCSYLNLELSLIRPQQKQQSIHSHASTIALQPSPSQPASQLTCLRSTHSVLVSQCM